jgi:hypothetical protein
MLSHQSIILGRDKHLKTAYKTAREEIDVLFFDLTQKQILLESSTLDDAQKSLLRYDISLMKKELDRAICKKEQLNRDIAILQYRLKAIEHEIKKDQPFWKRLLWFL